MPSTLPDIMPVDEDPPTLELMRVGWMRFFFFFFVFFFLPWSCCFECPEDDDEEEEEDEPLEGDADARELCRPAFL